MDQDTEMTTDAPAVEELQEPTSAALELSSADARMVTETTAVSGQPLTLQAKQAAILLKPFGADELDVKPDSKGAVYITHTVCRDRLHKVFGPFGWKLVPTSRPLLDRANRMLYREFQLYVEHRGQWVAGPVAMGEQVWLGDSNPDFSWGDALEGAESIGLSRCCKRIGMTISRRQAQEFLQKSCVRVFTERQNDSRVTVAWRRLDAPPIFGETDCTPDSPNRAKYQRPPAPWWYAKQGRKDKPAADVPTAPPPPRTPEGDRISVTAQKALWAAAKQAGLAQEDVVTVLRDRWHYHRSADIRKADYDAILGWVKQGGD